MIVLRGHAVCFLLLNHRFLLLESIARGFLFPTWSLLSKDYLKARSSSPGLGSHLIPPQSLSISHHPNSLPHSLHPRRRAVFRHEAHRLPHRCPVPCRLRSSCRHGHQRGPSNHHLRSEDMFHWPQGPSCHRQEMPPYGFHMFHSSVHGRTRRALSPHSSADTNPEPNSDAHSDSHTDTNPHTDTCPDSDPDPDRYDTAVQVPEHLPCRTQPTFQASCEPGLPSFPRQMRCTSL